ncbi:Fe2+-dependent dioxygenase [Ensifer sp.]|jgi:PKHD-type hydroxylase|uniref:Fe2+-dependent dioxygenase n=1 Tax=Ensifer sp. TaxID=1872086 RepID=UPI002E10FB24|nr:Fe2+-dependent dioxygenase [Ensifer sp.]
MILCIGDVLDSAALVELRDTIASGVFVDGVLTSGWASRLVKNNEQLGAGPALEAAQKIVISILSVNPVFSAGVQPRRFAPPLFARYIPGMQFGTHMDNAVIGPDHLRTDVSVTLFLSDPDDYDGGELVMESNSGEAAYKLPAGSAIAYPTTMLHRVEPVTRGVREVAVTWVQSLVRRADQREILFDLDRVGHAIFEREGKSEAFDLINKSTANLRRMWVDS